MRSIRPGQARLPRSFASCAVSTELENRRSSCSSVVPWVSQAYGSAHLDGAPLLDEVHQLALLQLQPPGDEGFVGRGQRLDVAQRVLELLVSAQPGLPEGYFFVTIFSFSSSRCTTIIL